MFATSEVHHSESINLQSADIMPVILTHTKFLCFSC